MGCLGTPFLFCVFMKIKTAHLLLTALVSISVLPFLNVMRYAPMPDWGSNATALLMIVLAGACGLFGRNSLCRNEPWHLPSFLVLAISWWLLVFLPYSALHSGLLPMSEMAAILMAIFAAGIFASLQQTLSRERIVGALAWAVLAGGLLQSVIALLQLLQLAELARGWLMFTVNHDIIGNISQRNQLAHVLTWSGLAAVYLWQRKVLTGALALAIMLVLATVIAWSGGRLPIAYAMAFFCFSVVFFLKLQSRALAIRLAVWAALTLLMQYLGPVIADALTGRALGSGLARLAGEGFGERRQVEWQKAWLLAQHFPWFGVGFGEWAYYSTWLEAFGGFAKVPESSLFTHSHNLFFQLLAETGWPATLFAAAAVAYCLWPYLLPRNHSPENVFLLMLAVVLLIHSLFEYPLWYLPFLVVFFFVLALSPREVIALEIRYRMRWWGQLLLVMLAAGYLLTAYPAYRTILDSQAPGPDAKVNAESVDRIFSVARNPFFVFEAELALSNYLVPTASDVAIKLHHYEQMVRYRPYPSLLTNLAILRALAADPAGAKDAMTMAISAYPASLPTMLLVLSQYREHEIQPLKQLVFSAVKLSKEKGDKAAVASVASSHLDRPLP